MKKALFLVVLLITALMPSIGLCSGAGGGGSGSSGSYSVSSESDVSPNVTTSSQIPVLNGATQGRFPLSRFAALFSILALDPSGNANKLLGVDPGGNWTFKGSINVTLGGFTASKPACTDASGNLTDTCTGTEGTWQPVLALTTTGLTAGSAYYIDASGNFTAADASTNLTLPRPALCLATSTTTCAKAGTWTTTGLTAGAIYYVSVAGSGALTATEPTTSGNIVQIIGIARSTTILDIMISPNRVAVK